MRETRRMRPSATTLLLRGAPSQLFAIQQYLSKVTRDFAGHRRLLMPCDDDDALPRMMIIGHFLHLRATRRLLLYDYFRGWRYT